MPDISVDVSSKMPQDRLEDFPELSSKLAAPTKKSVFERQKAEAEAKRQREQQETAAVYEDFVKSFDDEDDNGLPGRPHVPGGGSRGGLGGGPPRRHFSNAPSGPGGRGGYGAPAQRNSGPGSLGPPPQSLSRKRTYDGAQATQRHPEKQGLFAFDDAPAGPVDAKAAFALSDEDDGAAAGATSRPSERAVPQPTLRLSSLPPGTSPAVIKALIPSNLSITNVRILPASAPSSAGGTERKSLSAVAYLAKDTPALDIDTVVSALQNRYLGYGFYLSISRHFSSSALDTEASSLPTVSSSLPFGARPIPPPPGSTPLGRSHPSGPHRGGFAPPSSYNVPHQVGSRKNGPPTQVNINPPHDLKQLKLIHKTIETLLSHGPEFEALLMTRREVQTDEKWAWIWNPRSAGGVYYRWRLYDILTGAGQKSRARGYKGSHVLFEGGAPWAPPEKQLPFEYTTNLDEVISDSDYNSSDDDSSDAEGPGQQRRVFNQGDKPLELDFGTSAIAANSEGPNYLTPVLKAKLTHLLARLPTSTAKLRRGDVARVTAFAIRLAGAGADEVVQMLVSNVRHPFAFASANPDYKKPSKKPADDEPGIDDDHTPVPLEDLTPDEATTSKEIEDTSPSSLIALYLISDILSSSSTSGVRHAWRYRQLFDSALTQSKIFEYLGRTEKRLNWGRLKAEKWKRSVMTLLGLWEGWCVFNGETQAHFVETFQNPPKTEQEKVEEERLVKEKEEEEAKGRKAKESRWRAVDEAEEKRRADEEAAAAAGVADRAGVGDTNGDAMDVDGEPMAEDEDLDGEPMDEDLDGAPMADSDEDQGAIDGKSMGEGEDERAEEEREETPGLQIKGFAMSNKSHDSARGGEERSSKNVFPHARGRRPKAEDMFADDDSS